MEQVMFPKPEIKQLLEKFVRVRLYTDGRKNDEQKKRSRKNQVLQQERYKTTALPYYAILTPDNADVAQFKDGLTYDVDVFAGFLKSGLQSKSAASEPKSGEPKESVAKN